VFASTLGNTCQDSKGPRRESKAGEYQNEVPHHGLQFNDIFMNSEMKLITAPEVIRTRLNNEYSAAGYELHTITKLQPHTKLQLRS
jgi:hypothetical protein